MMKEILETATLTVAFKHVSLIDAVDADTFS
jgi:hypothetical protein